MWYWNYKCSKTGRTYKVYKWSYNWYSWVLLDRYGYYLRSGQWNSQGIFYYFGEPAQRVLLEVVNA